MTAIGFIETWGLIPAIEAADAMLKAADVRVLERTQVGSGLVTVTVAGSVSAVQASVEAGATAVERIEGGVLVSKHVIARPYDEVGAVIRVEPVEDVQPDVVAVPVSESVAAKPASAASAATERFSISALKKMKVGELRKLVRSLTGNEAKGSVKKELIELIVNVYRKIEE